MQIVISLSNLVIVNMATASVKHTNEAIAFFTLYKSMNKEIKEEVKELIINEGEDEEAKLFTSLALNVWDADNDGLEQSDFWEKTYNERKGI